MAGRCLQWLGRACRCAGGPLPRARSRAQAPGPSHRLRCPARHHQRLRRRPGGARSPPGPGPQRVATRGPGSGDRGSPVLASHARPGLAASWDGRPRGSPRRAAPRPPRHGECSRPRVGIRVPGLPAHAGPAPFHQRRERAPSSPGSGSPAEHPRPSDGSGHPDRHRGPHGHRERPRGTPVRDARGRERGAPPRDRHQQHALLLGAGPERRGAGDLRAARARAGGPDRGIRSPVRADQRDGRRRAHGDGHRLRPAERLRPPDRDPGDPGQLPAGSGRRRPRSAPSAIAWTSSSTPSPIRSWSPTPPATSS